MIIDLQIHSTYSDGYLSPTELAKFLKSRGIKAASLTDHNTIAGQEEFIRACRKEKIKTVPGLELYVKLNGKRFNLLWFNYSDTPELHALLRESQSRRRRKVREKLAALKSRGFKLQANRITDKYSHYIAINRLIDDILKNPADKKRMKKEIGTRIIREEDVIKKYFRNPNDIILRESYLNVERIIKLRKKIGGQLVINHPGKYNQLKMDFMEDLKKAGFDGIEVLSPHHNLGATMYAQFLARELNFIETGGSDFHKFEGSQSPIKCSHDYFSIDSKYLRGIEKIIG